MHLRDYLKSTGVSITEVRERMNALGADVQHDAQLRQWCSKKKPRKPNPANCLYLERATHGQVTRQAMRPDDYAAIWAELAPRKRKAASPLPA
jgi:DNA-binding transcriptional regulator YdaS (Cro superfamily)